MTKKTLEFYVEMRNDVDCDENTWMMCDFERRARVFISWWTSLDDFSKWFAKVKINKFEKVLVN